MDIKLLYIDLFCGAGGTSTGVERARFMGEKCAKVVACVNHDANAIASHSANHPDAVHYTEDIRTLELSPMVEHLEKMKMKYPESHVVLWASLECTNFSKAKGGMPRDADSRTLAEHLFRYIEAIHPDYIQIENVEEFMSWGDMDEYGHPISKEKGKCYIRWIQNVKRYGYDYKYKILNSADYGAYTSRKRYFGQFAKHGLPIAFPVATHSKRGEVGLFGEIKKWKPVKDVLDFSDEGESIFGRKKPLCEKTLERIYAGLIKFVAGGKDAFKSKCQSVHNDCEQRGNEHGVSKVSYLSKQFSGNPYDKNISVDGPAGTITCIDHHVLVTSSYLDMQYGNGTPSSTDEPAPVVTTNPKHNLVCVKPWIMNTSFGNVGSSIDEPSQVITANRKWHYLMNPQFASKGGSVNSPCFTLIARMDKMPPYLITTRDGIGIEAYDTDSEMTRKIKEFMAMYCIVDIKMRMLKVSELKRIMGFPSDYVLVGSQAEQKKYIGNAVEVGMAKVMCEALCSRLYDIKNSVAV